MQQSTYVTDQEQLPKGQNLSFSNKKSSLLKVRKKDRKNWSTLKILGKHRVSSEDGTLLLQLLAIFLMQINNI